MHALALEHGSEWLELTQRIDVCPDMTGRNFELWQPLLALAWWIEKQGAIGLLELMQNHARYTILASQDDQTPEVDETLLVILAERITNGAPPTPTEILDQAKGSEGELFRRWNGNTVARALKHYGLITRHSGDRRYRDVTLPHLPVGTARPGNDEQIHGRQGRPADGHAGPAV